MIASSYEMFSLFFLISSGIFHMFQYSVLYSFFKKLFYFSFLMPTPSFSISAHMPESWVIKSSLFILQIKK